MATHYNYYRDYDPVLGRYVESDPIGLRGGTNTYLYLGAQPLTLIDAEGLLVRGEGMGDAEWGQAQGAESKIRKQLEHACSCQASGAESCIPCTALAGLKKALETTVMNKGVVPKDCGFALVKGKWITVTGAGFTKPGCGCLAVTMYHELLHASGMSHGDPGDPVTKLDKKCESNLCK